MPFVTGSTNCKLLLVLSVLLIGPRPSAALYTSPGFSEAGVLQHVDKGLLNPQPVLLLSHHKTGTFFLLALFHAFCRGRAATSSSSGDLLCGRNLSLPELELVIFGTAVQLNDTHDRFRRIVHLVRPPWAIVKSALHYHISGHENHPVLLRLARSAISESWEVTAGIQSNTYCTYKTSSRDVALLVEQGERLLNSSSTSTTGQHSTTPHTALLRSLPVEQQLLFEAAWNWCEISQMLRIAEQLCAHAHAVQLDISSNESIPAQARSISLSHLARQITPSGQSLSWLKEAQTRLHSPAYEDHRSQPSSSGSAMASWDHDPMYASVYASLERRYSALQSRCPSWGQLQQQA